MRTLLKAGGLALLLLSAPTTSHSESLPKVDLALVLAIDVSGSVSSSRWILQRDGYVRAFRDPEVVDAITSGPNRRIVVLMIQWSDETDVALISKTWTIIESGASAESFADLIEKTPRRFSTGFTAIASAIKYCTRLFTDLPFKAGRRIIDISGDGRNTYPSRSNVEKARDEAIERGITINGLPIVTESEPDIAHYYEKHVIGGPRSFFLVADGYERFGEAVKRKLVLEIAAR
ncbi:hypothetical protein A2853_01170 [Candidatus Kaiserbacteria bacterium RIFCSPHIGHO2_01_FULL_55_17]|uniref:VWFA domain-containing protein n=1 Tax=Candidatus Kaiserbacteria bacterium RIFCSPHIGHO2_01_FULL_55_17 TaxID=1798484 RepID=A0A1F6D9G0_9BACT|nr:MAG: hypothetical protein A2853_01170 [Candidatus Kaiserbacteria bacterium RIFCSPHIGHO2_01_FULL_55_17]